MSGRSNPVITPALLIRDTLKSSILTHVLLALLPVFLGWRLKLTKRTKISLVLVLSLGIFACLAGIMKVRLNKTILPTHVAGDSMWNLIELDMGITAGSLPVINFLFNGFLDAAQGLRSGPSKASGMGGRNASGYQRLAKPSDVT